MALFRRQININDQLGHGRHDKGRVVHCGPEQHLISNSGLEVAEVVPQLEIEGVVMEVHGALDFVVIGDSPSIEESVWIICALLIVQLEDEVLIQVDIANQYPLRNHHTQLRNIQFSNYNRH